MEELDAEIGNLIVREEGYFLRFKNAAIRCCASGCVASSTNNSVSLAIPSRRVDRHPVTTRLIRLSATGMIC